MSPEGLAEDPATDVRRRTVGQTRLPPFGKKHPARPAKTGDVSFPSVESDVVGDSGGWPVRIRLDAEVETTQSDLPEARVKPALGHGGVWVGGLAAYGVPATTNSELTDIRLRVERHQFS